MKNNFKNILALSLGLLASSAYAMPKAHTWHTVSATNGTWNASLQMLNQSGGFLDHDGNDMSHFIVSPENPQDYGFYFNPGATFDVAYTLTLIQQKPRMSAQFVSQACVYVITASGPGTADVRALDYNGANCNWIKVKGRSNFEVN